MLQWVSSCVWRFYYVDRQHGCECQGNNVQHRSTKPWTEMKWNIFPDSKTFSIADPKIRCFLLHAESMHLALQSDRKEELPTLLAHVIRFSTPLISEAAPISVSGLSLRLVWSSGRVAMRGKAMLVKRRSALSGASRRKTLSSAL